MQTQRFRKTFGILFYLFSSFHLILTLPFFEGQVLAESEDFQILLPNKNLVPHIRALEKDLVLDHAKLFEGELWTQACRPKDWCDGLTLRAAETTAISQIKNTVNQLGQHFALVAVHKETTKLGHTSCHNIYIYIRRIHNICRLYTRIICIYIYIYIIYHISFFRGEGQGVKIPDWKKRVQNGKILSYHNYIGMIGRSRCPGLTGLRDVIISHHGGSIDRMYASELLLVGNLTKQAYYL